MISQPGLWAASALALFVGGVIKGALGVGLPLVSIPVLSLWLTTGRAIGLLAVPVVLSNLLQAREGGEIAVTWRRFRGLIIAQCIVTVCTVWLTTELPVRHLNILIASSVAIAVVLMWAQPTLHISSSREFGVGVAVGVLAGLLGGASSLTGPILIIYLMALRFAGDAFVRSISLIYLTGSLPIYGSMLAFGRISWLDIALSILALVPVYAGMRSGRAIRKRLDDTLFRRIVLLFLLVVASLLFMKN